MNHDEAMKLLYLALPYLLPIVSALLSYLFGVKGKIKVPARIKALVNNKTVQEIVRDGVANAETMKGMNNTERQAYARKAIQAAVCAELKEFVPDSALNFLIENIIVKSKK